MELERDRLKGLAKLTKKGELQSRIDRRNEEIDLLKTGLSGIVKQYGFQNVHDFYKTFAAPKTANTECQTKADRWEELYDEIAQRPTKESVHKRLRNYQKKSTDRPITQTFRIKDKRAR